MRVSSCTPKPSKIGVAFSTTRGCYPGTGFSRGERAHETSTCTGSHAHGEHVCTGLRARTRTGHEKKTAPDLHFLPLGRAHRPHTHTHRHTPHSSLPVRYLRAHRRPHAAQPPAASAAAAATCRCRRCRWRRHLQGRGRAGEEGEGGQEVETQVEGGRGRWCAGRRGAGRRLWRR